MALLASAASLLAFARVAVLVMEAYSAVRNERLADAELITMCNSPKAQTSVDFRTLCLKKRAEQASPIVFKALLRACASAFADFCECMSSPTKVLLLILFCFTGVAAPVVKAVSTLLVENLRQRRRRWGRKAKESDSDDSDNEDGHHHTEVVAVSSMPDPAARRVAAAPQRAGCARSRALCEGATFITDDDDDEDQMHAISFVDTPAATSGRALRY